MARKPTPASAASTSRDLAATALRLLEERSTPHDLANLTRFGINANNALGVSMANIQAIARQLGRNHQLAAALWKTGRYEARMLCAFVEEPARVTPSQMDVWCRDFDNWGICDTLCFKLFDQTPHAWAKVQQWSSRPEEFQKRAAFALLASLAGHDRNATDEQFIEALALAGQAANDDRHLVQKGVSWAVRRIGLRNARLRQVCVELARRLADSNSPSAQWVGRDALREFARQPSSKPPRAKQRGEAK